MRTVKSLLLGLALAIFTALPASALVYGPDRSGTYGGAQGIGGLDAVVTEATGTVNGVTNNYFGDALAAPGSATAWASVVGGYGAMPGSSAVNSSLQANWRGRYIDPTGFYYLGNRYYDPSSGTFLSCDPLGHAASMDLYSYCGGDPVNSFDSDGRVQSNYSAGWNEKIDSSTTNPDAWLSQTARLAGSVYGGEYQGATWGNFGNFQYGFWINGPTTFAEGAVDMVGMPFTGAYHAVADPISGFYYPGGESAYYEKQREQQMQGYVNAWNGLVAQANDPAGQGELTLDISSAIMTGRTAFGRGVAARPPPLPQVVTAAEGTTSLFGSSEYVVANGEQAMSVQSSLLRNYAQNATNPGIDIVEGLTENAQIDTVTGRISLSSDLVENYPHLIDGTVTEELFHFQQLQTRGLFGGPVSAAQSQEMEDEVVQLLLNSGFKKQ